MPFAENYSYDPNGNILTLNRNGDSSVLNMDQLSYKYIYAKSGGGNGEYVPGQTLPTDVGHLTNQLSSISDAVSTTSYTGDLESQAAFNYTYDAIGELTGDQAAQISNVTWNVYGKILSMTDSGNTISFTYDAAGNRISKTAGGVTTWYVRDASGNVLSTYTQGNAAVNGGALSQIEADVYGSSRLGVLDLSVNCGSSLTQPALRSWVRGSKLFELTNHLGNVLATISDRKLQHTGDNATVDYYLADVINAQDYYPFGMGMPGRSYTASSNGSYRYGFNGKENDNEVKGTGNQIDYGMRVYDPRVGRFLSVDPLAGKYPYYTPYQYAGNMPIWATDADGLEPDTTGKQEGEEVPVTKYETGPRGIGGVVTTNWYWHVGSAEYKTKAGWYNEEDYLDVIKPIAGDLAQYAGLLSGANNALIHNWTLSERANVADTKLGRFIGTGLSTGAEIEFEQAARTFIQERNYYVTGVTTMSSFNVEDMVGLGFLFKSAIEGFAARRILGSAQTTGTFGHAFTSNLIAWRYALNPNVERVTLDLGFKKLTGGGAFKWGPRPDVGVLFKDGTIKAFEVMSKTDVETRLFDRVSTFMNKWSIDGSVEVIKPFSIKAVYK